MRYLILTPGIGGADGVSRLSREIALSIRDIARPNAVDVWSLMDAKDSVPELERAGIRLRAAGRSKARLTAWSIAGLPATGRDTVVVVMHAHLAPLSLPFRWRGARVFQVLLGIEVWKRLSFLQARAFRESHYLVSISSHTARRFAQENPGFDPPLICHPGLPDPERSENTETASDDVPFALTVGRMSSAERYKGHDQLLAAWPAVRSARPDAKLVIVGGGDDRDRLIRKAETLGVDGAVRFAGAVTDDELLELYHRCAFFVMPSTDEGFGLVFLEAMQASKACIGGVGASAEIIEHGTTGLVVDPGDARSVTEAVVELFRDDAARERMGAEGRARYAHEFTREAHRERLRHVLAAGGATADA